MTSTSIALWAALLVAQNAAFTWVSRARNSGSDWYHAVAAVFSNGIFFAAIFLTIDFVTLVETWPQGLGLGAIYVCCTVTGSVVMGKFLRTFIERGDRKVGFYKGDKP